MFAPFCRQYWKGLVKHDCLQVSSSDALNQTNYQGLLIKFCIDGVSGSFTSLFEQFLRTVELCLVAFDGKTVCSN